jgi:RNA-directed DNA polymerase
VLYIRYADDFVILSPEREWLDIAINAYQLHISEMGLRIKPQKTRVVHTLLIHPTDGIDKTFDFLGFHFSQRRSSKYNTVKLGKKTTNIISVLLPAKRKVNLHFKEIDTIL